MKEMNGLDNQELIADMPENYEELKSSANRNANWRERLDAVEALGNWKNQKSIDILLHRLNTDAVYQVRERPIVNFWPLGRTCRCRKDPKAS